jgi:hypothetical protein
LLGAFLSFPAYSGDISTSNPLRKELLDTVRPIILYDKSNRFRVLELWASERFAFLCALIQDGEGHLSKTDEDFDVVEAILEKKSGKWVIIAEIDNLIPSLPKDSKEIREQCRLGYLSSKPELSDTIIEQALKDVPWSTGER